LIDNTMTQNPVLQSIVAKGTPEAINQPLYLEDTATLGDWG
jgi:hypothetical protein